MFTVIALYIFNLLIISSIIGISAFAFFDTNQQAGLNKKAIAFSFAIIVILDLMWYPALPILDLTITIGNMQMAKLLGTTDLTKVLAFEWGDLFIYIIQTLIAYVVGSRVIRRLK